MEDALLALSLILFVVFFFGLTIRYGLRAIRNFFRRPGQMKPPYED